MSADGHPTLGEILLETVELVKGQLFVRLPGEVIRQDPNTLRIDVRLAVNARIKDPITDELRPLELPVLSDVPVDYPGGGGFVITWPLVAGDSVYIMVCDRSIDEWRAGDPSPATPEDPRRFSLSDATAYPGGRRDSLPVLDSGRAPGALVVEGSDIRLGSSLATKTVAFGPDTDARLSAIETFLATHVHAGVTTGPGTSGVAAGAPVGSSVSALKVKAE